MIRHISDCAYWLDSIEPYIWYPLAFQALKNDESDSIWVAKRDISIDNNSLDVVNISQPGYAFCLKLT